MGPFYIMTSSTAPFQRERSSVGGIPAGMPCSHSSQMPRPPRFYWGIFIPILRSNKNPCGDSIVILYRSWSTVTMACCYLYIYKKKSRTYLEHQTSRLSSSTYVRPNPASGWSGSGSCPRRGLCGVVSGLQETRITSTASDLVENTLNKSIRPRTRWLTRFRFFLKNR